jgi:hypothetical protein
VGCSSKSDVSADFFFGNRQFGFQAFRHLARSTLDARRSTACLPTRFFSSRVRAAYPYTTI